MSSETTQTRGRRPGPRPGENGFAWQALWDAMQERGYCAESFAPCIGKTKRTVYAYLRGEITPPLPEIVSIAAALNVPESRLRDGKHLPVIFSP